MAWGARELHNTAQQLLAGEPLIVVSNREPWVHELAHDGSLSARHAVGGLVAALDPVLRATGGTWIAHGSGSGDHTVVDRAGRIRMERASLRSEFDERIYTMLTGVSQSVVRFLYASSWSSLPVSAALIYP